MLYIPLITAIEEQLQKDALLKDIVYYRFTLPTSSVRSRFVCIPWGYNSDRVTHATPRIADKITDYCIGNYCDRHDISLSILVGAAKHGSMKAEEVLDVLQDHVLYQIKADRYMGGSMRYAEPTTVSTDSFFEISKNHVGSIIDINIKYVDASEEVDEGQILYLLDMEVNEG